VELLDKQERYAMGFIMEKFKLKQGDIQVKTTGELTALIMKDKTDVHVLTNMHNPPAEGNFCDDNGNASKITSNTWAMWTKIERQIVTLLTAM
jgi:hypothetical protein